MKNTKLIAMATASLLFICISESKAESISSGTYDNGIPSCKLNLAYGDSTKPVSANYTFQMDPSTNEFYNITLNSVPQAPAFAGGKYVGDIAHLSEGAFGGGSLLIWFSPTTGKVIDVSIEGNSLHISSSNLSCPIPLNPPSCSVYVTNLYQSILGRAPDQDGYEFWSNLCTAGLMTRDQIVVEFYKSPEFVNSNTAHNQYTCGSQITGFYQSFLYRNPDSGGYSYWINQCVQGPEQLGLIAQDFITSPEYQALHSTN